MAQNFIEIGAKYGAIDVQEILPCATTVGRHLQQVVEDEKTKLLKCLSNIRKFGVTCDGWTHENTNAKYVTVTVQFLDDEFITHTRILSTINLDEKNTAEAIKACVTRILRTHQAERSTNVFVTHNAANIKAAFRAYTWIGCACHNLNFGAVTWLSTAKE